MHTLFDEEDDFAYDDFPVSEFRDWDELPIMDEDDEIEPLGIDDLDIENLLKA